MHADFCFHMGSIKTYSRKQETGSSKDMSHHLKHYIQKLVPRVILFLCMEAIFKLHHFFLICMAVYDNSEKFGDQTKTVFEQNNKSIFHRNCRISAII